MCTCRMEPEKEAYAHQELTEEQKKRIQKNKDKARLLKEQRKRAAPYERPVSNLNSGATCLSRDPQPSSSSSSSYKNSHAGFMYDEDDSITAQQHKYRRVEENSE